VLVRHDENGLTLVELMVVVAIVGILAAVAVFMFTKQTRKAKASEVPAVFAELKLRQEQFHLEHSQYLTTGDDDDSLFPTDDPGRDAIALDVTASPVPPDPQGTEFPSPSWQSLRISTDKTALYCGYVAIAGDGGDDTNVGATAGAAPFDLGGALPVPATNWYYLLARCDFDGDDTNSVYFTLSGSEGQIVENAGE